MATFDDPGDSGSAYDWILQFAKSGWESIPELIGITPSTDTIAWRQDNPWSAFMSEMAGTAVPYAGWFKATKALSKFDKAINAIGDYGTKPFATGVKQTAARFAPFEAGRLATSQVVGDEPFSSMLADTGLNLALGSGLGGLISGVASAGVRDAGLKTLFPGIDVSMPPPLMARKMREIIDSGKLTGEDLGKARARLNDMLRAARVEELPEGLKYIAPVDYLPDVNNERLTSQLNRLFKPRDNEVGKVLRVKRFAAGAERDFPDQASWEAAAREAGLPPGFEEHGQYFRQISFTPSLAKPESVGKIARVIDKRLTSQMEKVDDATWITREADDGMFIVAKKVGGTPGTGSGADKWVLFKTDKPGLFAPEADRWAKIQIDKGRWTPGMDLAADGGEVYNTARNFVTNYPLRNYMAMAKEPGLVGRTIDKLMPQGLRGPQQEISARVGEAIREYLAPRVHQFKKSWRANWIVNATKATYEGADTLAQELMNGAIGIEKGKGLFLQSLRNKAEGFRDYTPVRSLVGDLSEDDFRVFWEKVWRPQVPVEKLPEMQLAGEISPEVMRFGQALSKVDDFVTSNVTLAERAVGKTPTKWVPGHYGLSRTWDGDTRVILRNDAGEITAQAGGVNRSQALKNARRLEDEGVGVMDRTPDGKVAEFDVSQIGTIKDVVPTIRNPSFLLEAQGIRGFRWDTEPFTKKEFLDAYDNGLRGKMKYQANITTEDMLAPFIETLKKEDSSAYRQVLARMNDYSGAPSAFTRIQNKAVDAVLAPMMGANSASRIVQATNTGLYNFQLGALKLSYPVVNALQFIQTVMPEVAFLMGKTPAETLAGRYAYFAAGGTKGPVGAMAVLSPIKMAYHSFKEMVKPGKELTEAFQRAVNERVIDPRLVEEYIGASAVKVGEIGKVLKGEANFTEWLRALSEAMPAVSERLSRTQAFTQGWVLARDFLSQTKPLSSDQMYQFAKQFTENTMYLYNASDKPRIFTTPAGSMLGLFKNWMFHFMGQMGEYTKTGFIDKNWAPLLWQTAGTAGLGGLAATPLAFAADGFSKMFAQKSMLELAYDQFGEGGDAVMLGLPAAITGVSLYSAVNTPLSNPVRDASSLFSVVAWDRVKSIGKAAGAAFDNWQATGEHPAHSPNVREMLVRAFAPTSVYRTLAAMTEPDSIVQLGTDYPMLRNASGVTKVLYSLGFNPAELDRANAVSQELYAEHKRLGLQQRTLGDAWAEAQVSGDTEGMATIMRQAMTLGLDISQVMREAVKDLKKRQQDVLERAMRPADIRKFLQIQELMREGR